MLSIQLDQNLYVIAGGANYAEIVFNLIIWAESQGRLEEVVDRSIKTNPGNPDLHAFSEQIRESRSATLSAGSSMGTAPSNVEVQTKVTETTDRMILEPALQPWPGVVWEFYTRSRRPDILSSRYLPISALS